MFLRSNHAFALLSAAFFLISCGTSSTQKKSPNSNASPTNLTPGSQAAATTGPKNLVYLAVGGWNSCEESPVIPGQKSPHGMNMNKNFSKLIIAEQARRPGGKVSFVMGCHTPDQSVVRFVSSDAPQNLRIEARTQMVDTVVELARRENSELAILGHSYGGPYAMAAVDQVAGRVGIRDLITIDGISPVNCPSDVLAKLIAVRFSSITGIGTNTDPNGKTQGCLESPREFDEIHRQSLRSKVSFWQNYYQNDLLSVLKSGPINQACNQPVKHDTIEGALNGHIAMGMYEKLWLDIQNIVFSTTPPTCTPRPAL